jgi:hypothetical protein
MPTALLMFASAYLAASGEDSRASSFFASITAQFLSRSLAAEAESQYSNSPTVEFRRLPIAAGARLTSTMARAKCSDV